MSCTTPCLMPAALALRTMADGLFEVGGDRLLAIDVLAGVDGLGEQRGAHLGGGGIEEDGVVLVGERLVEVGGAARDAVRLGERGELLLVAADQDRIGHDAVAVLERHAALRADGGDGADEVLVGPHAPGDAVHDDAEPLVRPCLSSRGRGDGQLRAVSEGCQTQDAAGAATIPSTAARCRATSAMPRCGLRSTASRRGSFACELRNQLCSTLLLRLRVLGLGDFKRAPESLLSPPSSSWWQSVFRRASDGGQSLRVFHRFAAMPQGLDREARGLRQAH